MISIITGDINAITRPVNSWVFVIFVFAVSNLAS